MFKAKSKFVLFCSLAFAISLPPGLAALASGQRSLIGLERKIARDYPVVRDIFREDLERLQRDGSVLLIDVRGQSEHAVSHIPGSVLVAPNIETAEFVRRFGEPARGKLVVLYCSVGVRSSRLAERVNQPLKNSGAIGVVNLSGGIFSWHNTGRPLGGTEGEADRIHPYSRAWSYFLDFDNYTSFGDSSSWWREYFFALRQ